MLEISDVTERRMVMGEGPLWDSEQERLYWLDIMQATVYQSTLDGRDLKASKFPAQAVASLALRKDGGTIVSAGSKMYSFDLDTGDHELVFDAGLGEGYGFNDGTVDRQGRFVTGMADRALIEALVSGESDIPAPSGNIYRMDTDLSTHVIGDPIGVTNGPCFDGAGTTFYCNDSAVRCVYAWDYDAETGKADNRRLVVRFEEDGAIPDGATVDEEGYLWVAAYEGGEVRRYAPDGTLDRRLTVPVLCPTSVAFAGSELDVLVVTSRGGSTGNKADGRILAIRGLGVNGLAEAKFG